MNKQPPTRNQKGFTYIELILYIAIVAMMVGSLVRFGWSIIEGGIKSAVAQEVYSNTRFISERIKYEIRNAKAVNSVSASTVSLANFNASLDPTVITFTSPNLTVKQGAGSVYNLNSADTLMSAFVFTNLTTAATKQIQFTMTVQSNFGQTRNEYQQSMVIESSAELRSF